MHTIHSFFNGYHAKQGHVDHAIHKIKDTLAWRKEFEVDKIVHCFDEDGDLEMRAIIQKENETGKIYMRGYEQRRVVLRCT
jgi:hypothetical protein